MHFTDFLVTSHALCVGGVHWQRLGIICGHNTVFISFIVVNDFRNYANLFYGSLSLSLSEIVFLLVVILRFNKFAKIVVYAWEDTFVEFASCLMMM